MIYFVDIDDTICRKSSEGYTDYENSQPLPERIAIINKLYDEGNTVVYWTARGSGTGIDWREVTEKQFAEWGVKYHDLRFGKPHSVKSLDQYPSLRSVHPQREEFSFVV